MRLFLALSLLILSGCPSKEERQPASVPKDIAVFTLPVRLVCSAPATSQGIFQFSGIEKSLIAEFHENDTKITGKAMVLLRDSGDTSSYEGTIDVKGTRSPDATTYNLEADVNGEKWKIELRRNGDSTIWRQVKGQSRTYHANCVDEQ